MPKQNLPVSCEISDVLGDQRDSCTNLTFESVSAERLDRLVESRSRSRTTRDRLHDLCDEALVEDVGAGEVVLEVGRAGEDDPRHVHLVRRDEHLRRHLRHLAHVVVALLEAEARKAQRRLAAAPVLLRQVDRELVEDLAVVARERAEEEPLPSITMKPNLSSASSSSCSASRVELVVAQVERGVDRLERLEVDVHRLLLVVAVRIVYAVDPVLLGGTLRRASSCRSN